ncbi:MAG: NAD(P)H-hydrate dehydratase [Phycisphaerales bacterium]|nr:NAD(P)H-hydrate dehydratase [Phycisphaerales bacterium]
MPAQPAIVTDVPILAQREPTAHKGQVGRVGIVAGSPGMSGAAVLCALGALRGGAGLVRVYCPTSIQPIVAASEPCLMTVGLEHQPAGAGAAGAAGEALAGDTWPDVLAVGPGLGEGDTAARVTTAALSSGRPVVLDADGLRVFMAGGCASPREHRSAGIRWPAVLTPHPGEMTRLRDGAGLSPLAGDDDATRVRVAHEYACLSGSVIVLKGYRTVVCTPSHAFINTTGNPGMASGGMGDVLTGLIAALIGQGLAPFEAACLGVQVHGLAGDLCAKRIGPIGFLARDVADALPAALADALRPRMGFHQPTQNA